MAQKAGSSVGAGFGPALGFSSGVHSVDVVDADVACGRRDVRVCALGLPQLFWPRRQRSSNGNALHGSNGARAAWQPDEPVADILLDSTFTAVGLGPIARKIHEGTAGFRQILLMTPAQAEPKTQIRSE